MDLKEIIGIFKDTQEELKDRLHGVLIEKYGKKRVINKDGFLYAKGTHPVLLVAHLDTVHKTPPKDIFLNLSQTKMFATEGIGGDDRCGVVIILDIIKKIDCSVLFTEDEEIGGLGATKFGNEKYDLGVNYVVEFDRKGNNDYVFYKKANPHFEEHIKKFGFVKSSGTYSDISEIADDYEIEAVNLSSGYYNPHTTSEWVSFEDMADITERAIEMIATPTEKFDYVIGGYSSYYSDYYSRWYGYDSWSGSGYSSYKKGQEYPIKVYSGQALLKVNGKNTKYISAIINPDESVSDITTQKGAFIPNKDAVVELWTNKYSRDGKHYKASYSFFKYNYPEQILELDDGYEQYGFECQWCRGLIDANDELGMEYGICEDCRRQFYGTDEEFLEDYLYE